MLLEPPSESFAVVYLFTGGGISGEGGILL